MFSGRLGKRNIEKDVERLLVEAIASPSLADLDFTYKLSAATTATDTTLDLNKAIPNVGAHDIYLVIDPFTTECELRKATSISGNTYTVDALTYAHAKDDPVLYTVFPYCNVKWFDAKGDGTTDDLAAINRATTAAGETKGAAMIVEFPPGTYLVSDTVDIPNKVIVRGAGPIARTGAPGSTIQAKSTFAASTPLVQLGDDGSNSVYCRLEDMGIDGNHYADIGVYSDSINEQSGLIRCTVTDCDTYGIHMDNSASGLLRNFLMRDLYILNDSGGGTAIGVYIHGGSSPQRGIDGLTVDGSSYATGLRLDACLGAVFERIHLENATDGIRIGQSVACHNCTFIGLTGHSTLTDLVHIDSGSSSSGLTFISSYKNSATNNINDAVNSITLTGGYVNHYSTGVIQTVDDIRSHSGDIYNTAWNNYYSSSTVTGLTSLSTTNIYYKQVGNLIFVNFNLIGTNNASTITFTVPTAATTGAGVKIPIRVQDNGTWQTTPGYLSLGGSTVTMYKTLNSGSFTGSGTGGVQGQFWYEVA